MCRSVSFVSLYKCVAIYVRYIYVSLYIYIAIYVCRCIHRQTQTYRLCVALSALCCCIHVSLYTCVAVSLCTYIAMYMCHHISFVSLYTCVPVLLYIHVSLYTCVAIYMRYIYVSLYKYIAIYVCHFIHRQTQTYRLCVALSALRCCIYVSLYTLIERHPPPRGGLLFTMFPYQEPCVRGPPSKDLYHVLRGGSSYTRFWMREHSK